MLEFMVGLVDLVQVLLVVGAFALLAWAFKGSLTENKPVKFSKKATERTVKLPRGF